MKNLRPGDQITFKNTFDAVHPDISAFWRSLIIDERVDFFLAGKNLWARVKNVGLNTDYHLVLLCSQIGYEEFAFHLPPDQITRYSEEEMLRLLKLRSFE